MNAVFATYGTTGDVQPLLALALELRKRGNIVTFGAPPRFGEHVRKYGLDFFSLGSPLGAEDYRQVYARASHIADPVQQVQRTLMSALQDTPQMIEELACACKEADVLIAVPFQLAGAISHELFEVPLVSVHLSPFGGYNRRFSDETSRIVNDLRASYGLAAVNDPLGPVGGSPLLSICAVSSVLLPRPRRWPEHCHATGFLFLEEEFAPDQELAAFMHSGEPPVVITFGSMTHLSPKDVAQTVAAAIEGMRRRVIIQPGWTGLQFEELPQNVRLVEFVPYQWLFPKAACVVHSGGAGTTAHVLRAGVPSVVVPHMLDQFLWATLLKEHGCASDVIPITELTSTRLASAIRTALLPAWREQASRVAQPLRREDGVSVAADLIESHVPAKNRLLQ